MIISYFAIFRISKITVTNSCRIKLHYSGIAIYYVMVFGLNNLSIQIITQSTINPTVVNIPSSGDYYIMLYPELCDFCAENKRFFAFDDLLIFHLLINFLILYIYLENTQKTIGIKRWLID